MFHRNYGYGRTATPAYTYIINEEQDINEDYGFFYILDIDVPAKPIIRTRLLTNDIVVSQPHTNAVDQYSSHANAVAGIAHANAVAGIAHVPDMIRTNLIGVYSYNPLYTIIYSVFNWIFQQQMDDWSGVPK